MKILIMLLGVLLSPIAFSGEFCERQPEIDPEFPVGLVGDYEVIGKAPGSDETYSGTVTIAIEDGASSYRLTRTVKGEKIFGEAWIGLCAGQDKVPVLMFEYSDVSPVIRGMCYTRWNLDNYHLISCYVRAASEAWHNNGYEAMFPVMQ